MESYDKAVRDLAIAEELDPSLGAKAQIEKIRNDWVSLKNRNRLLYWLEQNQDLTEWSLLYIKNNFLYKRLPRWATNIDGLEGYEREKEIIVWRYGLDGKKPMTQKKVGEKLGISRSYVSRIEKRALEKLKKALDNSYRM